MAFHSRWHQVVERTGAFIAIVDDYTDTSPCKTVTNDAEYVVGQIKPPKGVRLIYRDTDGRWDELKHDGAGHFTGFAPLGVMSLGDAITKVTS
jgi:hypothetical protein